MHGEKWSAAERIRQIRLEHGLTQKQFAVRVQKDRTTISNWETGKSQPSVEDWMMIRDAFGYQTVSDAMGERRTKGEPVGWADYRRVIAALRRSGVLSEEHWRWLSAQAQALEAGLAPKSIAPGEEHNRGRSVHRGTRRGSSQAPGPNPPGSG